MPHCELHYSNDLELDAEAILARVESIIQERDPTAQGCKGRAYPAPLFRHTHFKISVYLIAKPHRDDEFVKTLMIDLEEQVKLMLTQPCLFTLSVEFSPKHYVTNDHVVA